MKVDHVVAEIDGTRSVPFDYVTAECLIEREHCVSVFHWKGDMIKAPDASRLLSDRVLTANYRASRGHASDKFASRSFVGHVASLLLFCRCSGGFRTSQRLPWLRISVNAIAELALCTYATEEKPFTVIVVDDESVYDEWVKKTNAYKAGLKLRRIVRVLDPSLAE
jgi:hypothetical protein